MPEPLPCSSSAPADHAQLYELLISELTDFAVFLADPDGCITSWNPGVERLLGYAESEWIGKPAHVIFTPEDRLAGKPEEEMAKAARDGRAPDIRWHQRKDGSRLYVEGTMVTLKDNASKLLGFSKVMRDITARQQAEEALRVSEERQVFLLMLSDAIRPLRDPEAVKMAASRVLGERLQANRAYYAEVTGDDWVVEGGYEQGVAPLPPGRYAAGTYGRRIMETYRAGGRVVFRDTRSDPGFTAEEREAHVALDILGAVGVPLVKEGKLVAILAVNTAEPRDWSGDDLVLVEETAERTWAAVEQARAEASLRESEARSRTLFSSIDEGFCIIEVLFDSQGKAYDYQFLEVNPAFEKQTGMAGAIGRTMREFVPHLEEHWFETYGRVALSGEPVRFENQAAGLGRFFEAYAFRVGKPEARQVAVLFRDVTEWQRAEAALRESEARFRVLTESLPQLVWTCLPDGRCDYLSRQWVEYTGTPEAEQLELNWLDRVIYPEDRQRTLEHWLGAVAGRHPYDIEYRIRAADGSYRWFQTRGVPLRDSDGVIVKWFGTCTDIDSRKHVEEELTKANRELEEFAYVASHDLQEPLRMVNSYTQLLLRRNLAAEPDAQEFGRFIRQGVTRMEALIRDLLDFSRTIQNNGEPATGGRADLSAALTEALSVLQNRIEESGAVLTTGSLPVVFGDTQQLALVLQNLLSNALKYCNQNVRPEIRIGAEQKEGQWTISVEDNGIGFEQKYAERIFGLFKRLHKDEYPGTGLGLAICQRIVERYGGRIWAESEPGVGSTFFFALPAVPS